MIEDSLSFELANSERRIAHAANKGFAIAGGSPETSLGQAVLRRQICARWKFSSPN